MVEAIGDVFALGVAIWLNPLAVAFLILILLSPRAKPNGIAFTAGWFLAILAVVAVAFTLSEATDADTSADAERGIDAVRIAIGIGFWVIAAKQLRKRSSHDGPPEPPKILDRIETLRPIGAAVSGALLAAGNLKTLPLALSAGATFASAGLDTTEGILAIVIFGVIASLSTIALVGASLILGERVTEPLSRLKDALLANLAIIIAVILILLGAVFIGQGLTVFA